MDAVMKYISMATGLSQIKIGNERIVVEQEERTVEDRGEVGHT
jgi:hypothetical protein